MNKTQKLEYQQQIEKYLEDNQIYDIFESFMKCLIKERPSDPIEFLLNKIETPEPKRIIIMGAPGSQRKEYALALADHFSITGFVSVGDLLNKEISKKSELAKKVMMARKTYSFINDSVVLQVVKSEIDQLEQEKKSWILEGFPRTRSQAIALQKWGILPDYFIILSNDDKLTLERVKSKLSTPDSDISASFENLNINEIEELAQKAVLEYKLNIAGVKEVTSGFYCEIDANSKQFNQVVGDIARIIKLKVKPNAPRKPPNIIIMGPPGSGRTTQAKLIAQKYSLIHIHILNLINGEIASKRKELNEVPKKINEGFLFPDELAIEVLKKRISAPDCKINGWILDGFPKTEDQIKFLKNANLNPSLVLILQVDDNVSFERLAGRKIDPETGVVYNIKQCQIDDESIVSRLISIDNDIHIVVKQRMKNWKNLQPYLENYFQEKLISINGDKDIESVTKSISESIENPPCKPQ